MTYANLLTNALEFWPLLTHQVAKSPSRHFDALAEVDLRSLIKEFIGALTDIAVDLRALEGSDSILFQRVITGRAAPPECCEESSTIPKH